MAKEDDVFAKLFAQLAPFRRELPTFRELRRRHRERAGVRLAETVEGETNALEEPSLGLGESEDDDGVG